LTTGRYREHYNSGAQTRQVDRLLVHQSLPRLQIHPWLALRHGVRPGARVVVESRRGRAAFRAEISADVRPDTLFAPFHWGGKEAANVLTSAALDPVSRMPEFKLTAVRIVAVEQITRAGSVSDGLPSVADASGS
jgi:assimilatory nitrate reductase catalytic subunit